jgi:hypothetical protein
MSTCEDLRLDAAEREAVTEVFRDELARGWIPRRADIEDALHALGLRGRT